MSALPPVDVPQQAPFLQATLEQSHVRVAVSPTDDGSLDYDLVVPRSWGVSSAFGPVPTGPLAERGIGIIARDAEPGSPVIAVTVTNVPFEIPIDAWARANLASEGWHIESAFWFPGANGLYFDITGTRVVDDVPEVRRTSVRVRGTHVFSVNCMCARKHWDEVKEIFWVAHATFAPAKPEESPMEPCIEVRGHNPDFTTAHPNSWFSEPVSNPPEHVSALDIRLVDADAEELLGYVQVKVAARPQDAPAKSLEELKQLTLENIQRSGFEPDKGERAISEDEDPRSLMVEGWRGAFEFTGRIAGNDVVVRFGFIDRKHSTATISLLRPPTEKDPLSALRTLRVFEIARAALDIA